MASVIDGDSNISITKTANGPRIRGDFDNTNRGNRVIFQTSNVGKESGIGVISNKDATGVSSVAAYAGVDPNNTTAAEMFGYPGTAVFASTKYGTATYGALALNTSGSDRLRIGADGRIILSTVGTNPGYTDALAIRGVGTDAAALPTNISQTKGIRLHGDGGVTNGLNHSAITYECNNGGGAAIVFGRDGSYGTFISLRTNDAGSPPSGTMRNYVHIDQYGCVAIGQSPNNSNGYPLQIYNTRNTTEASVFYRSTQAPAGKWFYAGVNNSNAFVVYNQNNVGCYIPDGATGWTANSDERIKDIIEPIENASEKVSTLRAVIGKYKKDDEGTRRSFLIAQDVQKVLPEAVDVQNDEIGTLGLQYTDLIPLLVAAIKEQREEIIALKERIEKLEKV